MSNHSTHNTTLMYYTDDIPAPNIYTLTHSHQYQMEGRETIHNDMRENTPTPDGRIHTFTTG